MTATCLHELVEAQAARTPAAVAVCAEAGSLTYADLDRRADRVASRLHDLGAGPEGVVAVLLERSLELPVALLGALKSGAACLPVDAELPVERVAPRLRDAGAVALLTGRRLRGRLEPPPAGVVEIDDEERWDAEPCDRAGRTVRPANLAYVACTAGSGGRPLAAMLPHQAVVHQVVTMQRAFELEVGEGVLHQTSLSVHVSLLELFWPLVSGARIVMAGPRRSHDPRYLWDLVERERVSTLHFAPTSLRVFLDEQPSGAGGGLTRVLCGGEALPRDLEERCRARLGAAVHDLYGSAETGVLPLGTPVAGTRACVATSELAPAPEGVAGRLYVGGPGLARGYGGMPGLTAERFVPDPFGPEPGARLHRTDDLATSRDGRLEYAGRADRQVEVLGQRIEPAEIEAALRRQDGVTDAVVGARQIDGETTLVAYVEAGILWRRLAHLRDALRRELPDVMVPRAWVVVDELPLTPGGRVDWSALPEPEPDDLQQEYVAPRDGLERQLADIWQEVFALERVGVHDDFFDLGGHSLLAVQIAMRLEPLAGEPVAVDQVLEHPTVATLAAEIRERPGQDVQIEPIEASHLDALLALCREHAAYEKADFHENGQIERWRAALFSTPPALHGWVALDAGEPCGFMTVTVDFATWSAEHFAYMDCLYLREPYRGRGLGRRFLDTLRAFCAARQYRWSEWQTPPDNDTGIGFYRRMGARSKPKLRFFYDTPQEG